MPARAVSLLIAPIEISPVVYALVTGRAPPVDDQRAPAPVAATAV